MRNRSDLWANVAMAPEGAGSGPAADGATASGVSAPDAAPSASPGTPSAASAPAADGASAASTGSSTSSDGAGAVAAAPSAPAATSLLSEAKAIAPKTDATKTDSAKADTGAAPAATPPATDATTGDGSPKPAEGAAPAKEALAEKPQAGEKTGEGEAKPPTPPAYDAWKIPEGIKLDDKQQGEFASELAEFETSTKADHAAVQAFGQKLIDRYVGEVQRIGEATQKAQRDAWSAFNESQIAEFKADPEYGGKREETSLSQARYVIDRMLPKQQADELIAMMSHTGMGNNLRLIGLLNKIYPFIAEPSPVQASANRGVARKSFQDTMYS
jgi:hypothetical protein